MTTDHERSGSEQRPAESAAAVVNRVDGSVTGAVVLAGSIGHVSVGAPAPPPADERLNLLATASRRQWTTAANDRRLVHPAPLPIRWRRSTSPVAGPASATNYPRFDPLPGLTAPTGDEPRAGTQDALHRLYGGLPSGRLLLVGPPGSGKSAAGILLLLAALRHRERATPEAQARIPVPVLFTLQGWNPDRGDRVTDWMAGKLAETYPMFNGRAGRRAATDLLTAGRVAGFLDGLDELPEPARPGVLAALADAPFRLVLLSRTAEAVTAARHRPLAGAIAVELQPVRPTDAATYLRQPLVDPPPAPWQAISAHLTGVAEDRRQASALSAALATPLALSLLRDVYGPADPVDELLNASRFPTAVDIENHLLDHAIAAAYTPRPGHPAPKYSVATAERTLRHLATALTEHGSLDLAWWHIPAWTTQRSRKIRLAVAIVVMNGPVAGLGLGVSGGLGLGPSGGLGLGLAVLAFALVLGLVPLIAGPNMYARGGSSMPRGITRLTYRNASRSLGYGLAAGAMSGLLAGLAAGLVAGLSVGVVAGLCVGLMAVLVGVILFGIARHTEVDHSSLGPADVWRYDRNAGLVYVLLAGLAICLVAVLTVRLVPGLTAKLATGFAASLSIGLEAALPAGLVLALAGAVSIRRRGLAAASSPGAAVVDTAGALVHLAIRHRTPLRLIAFLEDARGRHLLRTAGPVYQFRHATLQHRLAHPARPEGVSLRPSAAVSPPSAAGPASGRRRPR